MNWADVIGPGALISLLAATIRLAAPIIVAAAGESVCQRTGVFNLGLEGYLLMGAITSFITTVATGSPWLGVLVAIGTGLAMALLVGLLIIGAGVDQIITGITVVLLGTGLSSFLYLRVYGISGNPPQAHGTGTWHVPGLSRIPGVGTVLFQQSPLVYIAVAAALVAWWALRGTAFGLRARAVGDSPLSADEVGVSVRGTRWTGLLVSGATAAFAGAMVVDGVGLFRDGITAGRGWIALALVILARWNPLHATFGGVLFGFVDALQLRVQAASGGVQSAVPYELFSALPYVATLVVVIATARLRRSQEPRMLGVPFTPTR
jgi:ABC-type uncharacterized transport system permease subunit